MPKLPIDEGLKLFLPEAGKLANGFRRRYHFLCRRVNREEIHSTALALFVFQYPKYDPARFEFLKYFRHAVWRGLLDVYGAEATKENHLRVVPIPDNFPAVQELKPFCPWRFAAAVPKPNRRDVRRVLTELFNGDFLSLPSPTKCRVALTLHLRKVLGWSRNRTEVAYSMIREAIHADQ